MLDCGPSCWENHREIFRRASRRATSLVFAPVFVRSGDIAPCHTLLTADWEIINCDDNGCYFILIIITMLSGWDMTLIGCGDNMYMACDRCEDVGDLC